MTRKDYVMIAETIKGAINYEQSFNNNQAGAIDRFGYAETREEAEEIIKKAG